MALLNQHRNLSPDFQLTFDEESGYIDDGVRETARAVTGADGRFLADGIDLSPSIEPLASQAKDPPKLSAGKPWNPAGMPELPQRTPLRVRNTVTGHVFDWDPIFRLSENDDLEVIA